MICPNISSNGSSQNERALGSMLCLSRFIGTWGPLHPSFVFTSASICSSIFHTQTMASLNLEERWQTKTSSALERSKLMFNNTLLSDIKFAFPKADSNSMIPAHKYVLATSSPVFFTMFYGDLAETSDTVNIADYDSDVFLRFLRFIYCEEANFEDMMCAIDVWHLADKYDVPSLAKECLEYLDGNMDPVDAFDLLTYASQLNNEFLEQTCWEVIDYNAEAIVADESFLDVQHAFLLSFVKRSSARIKELSLFQALDRWATKKCEEASTTVDGEHKRRFLGEEMIRHFRFSLMSPKEFSDEVEPSGVLLANEILDVFKQFSSVSIPGGFKFSTSPRRSSNETIFQSCDLGNIRHGSLSMTHIHVFRGVSRKTGLLTFAVTEDISLSGVRIVTDKGRESCRVSLVISNGNKHLRQIKDHNFTCNTDRTFSSYGEIDVVFNRPIALETNTCYTIKTNTDTTNNLDSGFVYQHKDRKPEATWSISSPINFGISSSVDTDSVNTVISFSYFGNNCDQNCPEHSAVGGEITKLVFVHDNEPTDVPYCIAAELALLRRSSRWVF